MCVCVSSLNVLVHVVGAGAWFGLGSEAGFYVELHHGFTRPFVPFSRAPHAAHSCSAFLAELFVRLCFQADGIKLSCRFRLGGDSETSFCYILFSEIK